MVVIFYVWGWGLYLTTLIQLKQVRQATLRQKRFVQEKAGDEFEITKKRDYLVLAISH